MGYRPPNSVGSGSGFASDPGLTFSGTHTTPLGSESWRSVAATLTANHVDTITGMAAGKFVLYGLKQDATGGRTFSVGDANNAPVAIPINTGAGVPTDILVFYRTAVDFDVFILGGTPVDASTTVKGLVKTSTAPGTASNPVAVETGDPRVTADQAAGTASVRTLGTGAQQAAAGNHTHTAAAVGAVPAPGSPAQGDMVYYDGSAWVKVAGTKATGKVAQIQGDGSVAWTTPSGAGATWQSPLRAGKTYVSQMVVAGTNISLANNQASAIPFIPGRSTTISTVGVIVNAVGSSGAVGRVGIYTDNNGEPGTLVAEASATFDLVTATGVITKTITAAVTAGSTYWLVFVQQSASAGNAGMKGTTSGGVNPLLPVDPANFGTGAGVGITSALLSGALPSTAPSPWNTGVSAVAVSVLAAT